jgi:hypothetical protein
LRIYHQEEALSIVIGLQNRLKNMTNDSEYFLSHAPQPMAQRSVVKEIIVRPECPPPSVLNTIPSAEIQGDIIVKSRAYQLEMLEESLKRNVIVAVCLSCSMLLLFTHSP